MIGKITSFCKLIFIAAIILHTSKAWAQYSGGNGSPGTPYKIASVTDLINLSKTQGDWGGHFIQTANITFDANEQNVDWDNDGSATWDVDDQNGFSPIGNSTNKFTGNYDGQKYTIDNLYINRTTDNYSGLFGYTNGATIQNLGIVDCDLTVYQNCAALVGTADNTTISKCFTTGNVNATNSMIGGIAGSINSSTTINECYNSATINSNQDYVGGIAGRSEGVINNCYNTGNINSGTGQYRGGLTGGNWGTVSNSYSIGTVNGNIKALNGRNTINSINNFWDKDVTGITSTDGGGVQKTTAQMKSETTFTNASWDFTNIWAISSGINNGYPYLKALSPSAPSPVPVSPLASLSVFLIIGVFFGVKFFKK